jgi:hypothetical protein
MAGGRLDFLDSWSLAIGAHPGWMQSTAGGTPPPLTNVVASAWVDVRKTLYVLAADYALIAPFQLWSMSGDPPVWTQLATSGSSPISRERATLTYDALRDRLILFGGANSNLSGTYLKDTWALTLSGTPAWSAIAATNPPPGREQHAAIYDPVRDRLIILGGRNQGALNDAWSLPFTGPPQWSVISAGSPPPVMMDATAIYDPIRDRMIALWGSDLALNIVSSPWSLALSGSPAWSALSPDGGPPQPVSRPAAIYDPVGDRMVVSNGSGTNQTWQLEWGQPGASLATMSCPADVAVAPGDVGHLTFTFTNPLEFDMVVDWSLASARNWPGASSSGSTIITGGGSSDLPFDIDVPDTAAAGANGFALTALVRGREQQMTCGAALISAPTGQAGPTPVRFTLRGFRPNPSAAGAAVEFALPDAAEARLEIFDLGGRLFLSQEVGAMGAGVHSVDLSRVHSMRSGVYMIRLVRRDQTLNARGVLLR